MKFELGTNVEVKPNLTGVEKILQKTDVYLVNLKWLRIGKQN